MTGGLYLQCCAMFLLGQALHLFLVKIPAVKGRARAANKAYVFAEWWNCDWNVIIGTQVLGLLVIFGLDELLRWQPFIWEYVKWFFAGVGAFGSTIAMAKFSQYEKELTRLLDIKSNISDAVTGPSTTIGGTVIKGMEATGKDVTRA